VYGTLYQEKRHKATWSHSKIALS